MLNGLCGGISSTFSPSFQVPEWLHKSLHWSSVDGVSPKLSFITVVSGFVIIVGYIIYILTEKSSREAPLKAEVAAKDKALFKARNELLILKREMEESGKHVSNAGPAEVIKQVQIKEVAPKAMILELDSLKKENEEIINERDALKSQCDQFSYYQSQLGEVLIIIHYV